MQVEQRELDGVPRLTVRGDVDASGCGHLRSTLDQLLEEGNRTLVVEAHGIEFLDSSGLRVLLAAEERCRADGGELRLEDPSDAVQYVLEVTDLGDRFGLDL